MTDIFTTTLGVLSQRGVTNAFELATEIEDVWHKVESFKTVEDRYNLACKIVLRYNGRRPVKFENIPFQELNGKIFLRRMVVKTVPITQEDIELRTRRREIVIVRQMVTVLLHKVSKYTLGQCMTVISYDHSTLLHSCRTIQDLVDSDKDFAKNWLKIVEEFKKGL